MKILVTGANGFIGKNLIEKLKELKTHDIYPFDLDTNPNLLDTYTKSCDFVFHLAGVNRPENPGDFMKGNFGFTSTLLDLLKKHNNKAPIMISSSIQAQLNNPYGKSKKAGEDLILAYSKETGAKSLIYRFPNVFGKWSRPNYNSAIATFCYNIARDLPITINDPSVVMNLIYIDDLVSELINALDNKETRQGDYCYVKPVHQIKLGEIVDLIKSFKDSRNTLYLPDLSDPFTKKLHATYLSFIDPMNLKYELKMNVDHRGSFTEVLKSHASGQVSINISKPGIVKGNHWHHTKNEKFLVVSGKGVIRFRNVFEDKIYEYFVSGEKLEVIDIPTGYTHNIENLGDTDMVTLMWVNEVFDKDNPDTIFVEV